MNDIGLIRSLVREALERVHFSDRMRDRILDPSTISPEFDSKKVQDIVPFLRRVNFPEDTSVAVNIFRSSTVYRSEIKGEPVIFGNNLWVIIRGNSLVTLFFRKDGNPPDDVQYHIMIEKLWDITDKKGSYDLTVQDLKGGAIGNKQDTTSTRKRGLNIPLPMVMIRGSKWYADLKRELFIYAKNIKKVMNFDDAFRQLTNDELDGIMDQLSAPAMALSEQKR